MPGFQFRPTAVQWWFLPVLAHAEGYAALRGRRPYPKTVRPRVHWENGVIWKAAAALQTAGWLYIDPRVISTLQEIMNIYKRFVQSIWNDYTYLLLAPGWKCNRDPLEISYRLACLKIYRGILQALWQALGGILNLQILFTQNISYAGDWARQRSRYLVTGSDIPKFIKYVRSFVMSPSLLLFSSLFIFTDIDSASLTYVSQHQ